MTERKRRKLTRKEQDALKGLEREVQDEQNRANAKIVEIEAKCDEGVATARREASNKAFEEHQAFEKGKKELDKQKAKALKDVEDRYQVLLRSMRDAKKEKHVLFEDELNKAELALLRTARDETQKVNDALDTFIRENRVKQDNLIYGAPEPEEPKEEPAADAIAAGVEA